MSDPFSNRWKIVDLHGKRVTRDVYGSKEAALFRIARWKERTHRADLPPSRLMFLKAVPETGRPR